MVDPRFLRIEKKALKKIPKITEKIELPYFPVKWFLVLFFFVFVAAYLWDFVRNNDPNPELDFLPTNIQEMIGYKTNREVDILPKNPIASNDDSFHLNYEHIAL